MLRSSEKMKVQSIARALALSGFPFGCTVAPTIPAKAQDAIVEVDASKVGVRLSPVQHGIFFEEINHAGEGGLYAELLRNRNFKQGMEGWTKVNYPGAASEFVREGRQPEPYMRVTVSGTPGKLGGIGNGGYYGVGVEAGKSYLGEVEIADFSGGGALQVRLIAPGGEVLASQTLKAYKGAKIKFTLKPKRTQADASLAFVTEAPGSFTLLAATLSPKEKYRNRQNGLRKDLADKVEEVKPSFVRFPGGCYVEGDKLANRFQWKNTLGNPLTGRIPHSNLWGYMSSNGLGYHEYLQWCEDLKAEPLFVVNCGMSHTDIVPMAEMKPYVQDALDAIEYANGPAESKWGAIRAGNGHPKPFNITMVEIGNENGGRAYNERYALFYDAFKAKYPNLRLIANEPVTSRPMEIVDEHYYNTPGFFVKTSNRYDRYSRTGPKIYVGEYAVTNGCGQGNLIAGLGEAYFITGMERNADVVSMASYAPLFVNVSDRKWNPDAIPFDTLRSFGTPSYWVQQMFSANRGDVTLQGSVSKVNETPKPIKLPTGGIGVGTWRTSAEYSNIKVEQDGKTLFDSNSELSSLKPQSGDWKKQANGAFRQSGMNEDCQAIVPGQNWGDYTLTMKAKKLAGDEGFLIMFHVKDKENWFWWNIGGWGNTRHAIEQMNGGGKSGFGEASPGKIETNRLYDIRVVVKGALVQCYLDDKLIHTVEYKEDPSEGLGMVATLEEKSGDILIKLVNISDTPRSTQINLKGVSTLSKTGSAIVLTSEKPSDENSFENPKKIAPKTVRLSDVKPQFDYVCPAYSVSILRLKQK